MLSRTWSYSALRSLQHLSSSRASTTSLPALANAVRTYTSASRNSSGYIRIKPQTNSTAFPRRNFHSTPSVRKGITPDSPDPAPPKVESSDNSVAGGSTHIAQPSPLTEDEYREYSESYFNELLAELERTQEEGSDVEAEYSAGVLNVTVPGIGVYVLNKQPPNKQIWLSSPISGPKRFDWVLQGDAANEKEGTREYVGGQWIYLRNGMNLTELLNRELTLELGGYRGIV